MRRPGHHSPSAPRCPAAVYSPRIIFGGHAGSGEGAEALQSGAGLGCVAREGPNVPGASRAGRAAACAGSALAGAGLQLPDVAVPWEPRRASAPLTPSPEPRGVAGGGVGPGGPSPSSVWLRCLLVRRGQSTPARARAATRPCALPCTPARPSCSLRLRPEPLSCLWRRPQLASRVALGELGSSARAVIILFQKEAKGCNSEPAAGSVLPTCRLLRAAPRRQGGLGGRSTAGRGAAGRETMGACGGGGGSQTEGRGFGRPAHLCLWAGRVAGVFAASWTGRVPGPKVQALRRDHCVTWCHHVRAGPPAQLAAALCW